MGVAGQIFAARVAIGLAVPSPKALSETGTMLGTFSSKMYKRLNATHLKAAQERSRAAETELKRANANVTNFAKQQDRQLMQSAQASLNKTNKMYGENVASSGRQVQRMQTSMRKLAPSTAPKLFKNLTKDMNAGQKYQKIMRNFINLNKEERRVTLEAMKTHVAEAKGRAANAVLMAKENSQKKQWAAAQLDDALKLENSYKQMQQLDKDRTNEKMRLGRKEKELLEEQKKARDNYNVALDHQDKLNEDLIESQRRINRAMQNAVYTVKTGFQEILRESISILTGFYYKLNEATEGLKEFERELLNANSVFGLTRDELFETSQTIVQFGQQFGLAMDNGAAGLYQLASAGLSADEAMQVLPSTLKLSMAVQGDHNTISKLTAQTLFGFGMEMSEASVLTDKFAHAIQKSLIEYEDLGSAVKFALPFFTATGQSIDQLLGSLQVLTNRALEAGIAGRGLRQALAEFAEHAEDNTAAFAKMGINILNAEGEMLQLTEIARLFADAVGPETSSNTELLTALIEDLNVRGATAFIHLVQNADEFEQAVLDTVNAGGELDEMVKIQNESIAAQTQILKNNIQAIFFMRDANADGTETLNEFHQGVLDVIASLRGLVVYELADGSYALTKFGKDIRNIATEGVIMFAGAIEGMVGILRDFTEAGFINLSMLKAYFIPITLVLKAVEALGPNIIKLVIWWKVLNAVIPVSTMLTLMDELAIIGNTTAKVANTAATTAQAGAEAGRAVATEASTAATLKQTGVLSKLGGAVKGLGRMLVNPYVLMAALTAGIVYLVAKTLNLKTIWEGLILGIKEGLRMMKYAISPLTDLFAEWGKAVEKVFGNFTDNRAAMLQIMMEIGALAATLTYGIAWAIAEVLRFIVKLAGTVVDIVLGPNLQDLIRLMNWMKDPTKGMKDWGHKWLGGGREAQYAPGTIGGIGKRTAQGAATGAMAGAAYGIYGAWGGPMGVLAATAAGAGAGALIGGTAGFIGGLTEYGYHNRQAGGYVTPKPMRAGGYIVGERGPELFYPRVGGKILNSDRSRQLLDGQSNGSIMGQGMVNQMIVTNLVSENSVSNQSKISVDTFAGVV